MIENNTDYKQSIETLLREHWPQGTLTLRNYLWPNRFWCSHEIPHCVDWKPWLFQWFISFVEKFLRKLECVLKIFWSRFNMCLDAFAGHLCHWCFTLLSFPFRCRCQILEYSLSTPRSPSSLWHSVQLMKWCLFLSLEGSWKNTSGVNVDANNSFSPLLLLLIYDHAFWICLLLFLCCVINVLQGIPGALL